MPFPLTNDLGEPHVNPLDTIMDRKRSRRTFLAGAGASLGAVERVDGFGVVVIEGASIADYEPGQRSGIGITFGVAAGVGFDSGIGDSSAVLQ